MTEYKEVSLTDRCVAVKNEALANCDNEPQQAFGYLAMSVALLEAELEMAKQKINQLEKES